MSSVPFAQQNSERVDAIIAAEQDAKATVNQDQWWAYGCFLIGVIAADKTPNCLQQDLLENHQNMLRLTHKLTKKKFGTFKEVLLLRDVLQRFSQLEFLL